MSRREKESVEDILRAGARRLLARASDSRALEAEHLLPRLRSILDKYLLRGQTEAPAAEVEAFLERLHADDLLLVVACERGDESAWGELMSRFNATVLSAARSASGGASEAEELAQSVWAELHGLRRRGDDGAPAGKLAYYSGCGSLGGWLRAVVAQMAVDFHRRSARLVQTEEAEEFDRLADGASVDGHLAGFHAPQALDPERALADAEAAGALRRALERAIRELGPEERLLVKLYYFDNLRLREAGAVLGVHEATASRRLARAQSEVRRRVETLLQSEHGWTREEVARTLGEVAAKLETDIGRVLAT